MYVMYVIPHISNRISDFFWELSMRTKTPLEVRHCFINENIVKIIAYHTNDEIKHRMSNHKEINIRS